MAYSQSTAGNCRKLEKVHSKCLVWAKRFGLKFAPQKYELIHFTRQRAYDLSATIQLEGTTLEPKESVRVLGVWIDTKLNWKSHAREVSRKMASQTQGLYRVAASTWGATFNHSRQVYSAVVRSALCFGAPTWHTPSKGPEKVKGLAKKLGKYQNSCLRTIAGAYRATSVRQLETETFVPPLEVYLNRRMAAYHLRQEGSEVRKETRQICAKIRRQTQRRRRRPLPPTPGLAGEEWAKSWREEATSKVELDKRILREWHQK